MPARLPAKSFKERSVLSHPIMRGCKYRMTYDVVGRDTCHAERPQVRSLPALVHCIRISASWILAGSYFKRLKTSTFYTQRPKAPLIWEIKTMAI